MKTEDLERYTLFTNATADALWKLDPVAIEKMLANPKAVSLDLINKSIISAIIRSPLFTTHEQIGFVDIEDEELGFPDHRKRNEDLTSVVSDHVHMSQQDCIKIGTYITPHVDVERLEVFIDYVTDRYGWETVVKIYEWNLELSRRPLIDLLKYVTCPTPLAFHLLTRVRILGTDVLDTMAEQVIEDECTNLETLKSLKLALIHNQEIRRFNKVAVEKMITYVDARLEDRGESNEG